MHNPNKITIEHQRGCHACGLRPLARPVGAPWWLMSSQPVETAISNATGCRFWRFLRMQWAGVRICTIMWVRHSLPAPAKQQLQGTYGNFLPGSSATQWEHTWVQRVAVEGKLQVIPRWAHQCHVTTTCTSKCAYINCSMAHISYPAFASSRIFSTKAFIPIPFNFLLSNSCSATCKHVAAWAVA